MTELDQVLAGITARQARARVCLRGDLIAEHEQAEADLRKALADDQTENRHAAAPAVARRVVDLEQQIDAASTDFVMQAIGQRAWSDLLAEHPPSEEDRADGWAFNSRTFLVAAVGASCVSPAGMTAAGAERLFEMIRSGTVKVEISARYPLAEAAEAHRALESRATTGSLILLP